MMILKLLAGSAIMVDILQRISFDHQQVRERAFLDHAELSRIGIALTGQRQQFGVRPGRHGERFGGSVPADKPALGRLYGGSGEIAGGPPMGFSPWPGSLTTARTELALDGTNKPFTQLKVIGRSLGSVP
jgi:hypothetical protein